MAEVPSWLAQEMERRKFLRRSSQLALGVVAAGSAGQILGSPAARASERRAAASSSTGTVQGITLSGLQTDTSGNTSKSLSEVENEIAASKDNFGATHVRLQIQQQTFVGNGNQYNATYAQTVYSAINYALNLGLTVIINCQTEQSGTSRSYPYPNCNGSTATNSFWDYMLTSRGGNYGGNSRVICDLFNEPQCGPSWTIWESAYNGLIFYIRSTLDVTGNQLWADADNYAASLKGCPGLSDPAGNLVYSFHHPASGPGGDTAGWAQDFGDWAASHQVVNGEFAQNSSFNWGSPYEIQHYLDYCASIGIGQTLWTVYGDNYFSDSNFMPYGWWGHMIDNFWNPGNGWSTYCFRSSVKWSQNYIMENGNQLSWTDGLYQGWSPGATLGGSMLAGVAAFNSFTADMATGSSYRMHVSFACIYPDNGSMTAVVGVHGVSSSSPPGSWSGVVPLKTNIVELADLTQNEWCNVDIPASYLPQFASGYYTGIIFGPGPDSDGAYQGHVSYSPEVVIEVHP
jgi:hypothetical protein